MLSFTQEAFGGIIPMGSMVDIVRGSVREIGRYHFTHP